jgi:hypothetical protein
MNCNLGVIGTHDWPEPIRRQCLLSITRKTQGQNQEQKTNQEQKPGTGTETSMPDLIRQAWPPSRFFLSCLTGLCTTVAITRAA